MFHRFLRVQCCFNHDYGFLVFYLFIYFLLTSQTSADKEGTCERAVCECDGTAAKCFAEKEYNIKYFNWPAEKC